MTVTTMQEFLQGMADAAGAPLIVLNYLQAGLILAAGVIFGVTIMTLLTMSSRNNV